jgi:inhibitor of cysteine peptidase
MPGIRFSVLSLLLFLAPLACAANPSDPSDRPAPSAVAPHSAETKNGRSADREPRRPDPSRPERIVGQNARVADIAVAETDGRIVFAVRGSLPDGCTTVRGLSVARTDRHFEIAVWTERPAEAACTMALVPFSREIALDAELSPGEYTVRAGDRSRTFSVSRNPPN